jgi:hypothetical protein
MANLKNNRAGGINTVNGEDYIVVDKVECDNFTGNTSITIEDFGVDLGTEMLFIQSNAPVGWEKVDSSSQPTKATALQNAVLLVTDPDVVAWGTPYGGSVHVKDHTHENSAGHTHSYGSHTHQLGAGSQPAIGAHRHQADGTPTGLVGGHNGAAGTQWWHRKFYQYTGLFSTIRWPVTHWDAGTGVQVSGAASNGTSSSETVPSGPPTNSGLTATLKYHEIILARRID